MGHAFAPLPLSVVAPARNEHDNLEPLVEEIESALEPAGIDFEIVIVDDGSTDGTARLLASMLIGHPRLRVVRMRDARPDRGAGQSAAFHAGIRASRGKMIVTLDADRQYDPKDIPLVVDRLAATGADMVQGDRTAGRRDSIFRRLSSLVGRLFRRLLLGDTVRDTGCSLRAMHREVALALPLQYRGMHRYIPIRARQMGCTVIEIPVRHRPRAAGLSKYGTWDRAVVGIYDCLAVRWMGRREGPVRYDPVEPARSEAAGIREIPDGGTGESSDRMIHTPGTL